MCCTTCAVQKCTQCTICCVRGFRYVPLCHTCLLWRPRKVWQNATTIKDFSIKPVSSGWQPFKQMQMLTRHSEPSQCEFHLDKDWPSHLKFHQKVPLLLCQVRPIGWQAFWGGTGRTVGWLGSWFKTNCIYCTFLILYYQLDQNYNTPESRIQRALNEANAFCQLTFWSNTNRTANYFQQLS